MSHTLTFLSLDLCVIELIDVGFWLESTYPVAKLVVFGEKATERTHDEWPAKAAMQFF